MPELSHSVLAAHVLRGYAWNLLSNNAALSMVTGKGGVSLIPIIPLSDEPDLADSGQTYVIYGFIENEPTMSVHRVGTISFRVIGKTFAELGRIISILTSTFEIEDEAAANVNAWSSTVPAFDGIRFTSLSVTYAEAGDAETSEGGPVEGVVNLRYRYIRESAHIKIFDPIGTAWV